VCKCVLPPGNNPTAVNKYIKRPLCVCACACVCVYVYTLKYIHYVHIARRIIIAFHFTFFPNEGITITYKFTIQSIYVFCQLLNRFTEFYEIFHEVMKLLAMRFFAIHMLLSPLLAISFLNTFHLYSPLRMIGRVLQSYKRICNVVYRHL
jgi:hypothetical protein